MTNRLQVILCTCPTFEVAKSLAYQLIEQRLAACVNIIPQIHSIYRWENKIEEGSEWLLLIKSHEDCYAQLEQWIKCHHPYQVPELIALSIQQGLPEYLQWIIGGLNGNISSI